MFRVVCFVENGTKAPLVCVHSRFFAFSIDRRLVVSNDVHHLWYLDCNVTCLVERTNLFIVVSMIVRAIISSSIVGTAYSSTSAGGLKSSSIVVASTTLLLFEQVLFGLVIRFFLTCLHVQ